MSNYQLRLGFSLLQRLGLVLISFTIGRALFYLFNRDLFDWVTGPELFRNLVYGLRFDLCALAYTNIAFVVLATLPPAWIRSPRRRKLLTILFVASNGLVQLFNCIDIGYYRFTLKRATGELLLLFTTGGDFPRLLPQILADYWDLGLIWLGLILLHFWGDRRAPLPDPPPRLRPAFWAAQGLLFLILVGGLAVGMRGGVQLKPISLITASQMVGTRDAPLVANTPFTLMMTITKHSLEEKRYFPKHELARHFSPLRSYPSAGTPFRRLNVVIIIMESFGREYLGPPFGNEGLTPFLDSLLRQGRFFPEAFANGKNSMQAIPAVVAGLPSLMPDPFIASAYSSNRVESLASILAGQGYRTAFFHGGRQGTMGFDAFCRVAGFQEYYGLDQYPNRDDYDRGWGIYDEPFFQFFAHQLDALPEPFFAAFFSLSSHHPYHLPEKHVGKFPEGKHPLFKTIQYADYSLERFFETARAMPWFAETLFVITADHTAEAFAPFYQNLVGESSIPLLYFCPSDPSLQGIAGRQTQQIDILPTILDYLHYPKPFYSLGESALRETGYGYALSYRNGVYQILHQGYALHFNGDETMALYHYATDPTLQRNLQNDPDFAERRAAMETWSKAFIQVYQDALIHNRLTLAADPAGK